MQMVALVRSMLLPHGFPDSVAPQFAPYMSWRAAQVLSPPVVDLFALAGRALCVHPRCETPFATQPHTCSQSHSALVCKAGNHTAAACVEPCRRSSVSCSASQYFFGGALGVLSTRSLLGALGISSRRTGEASAAINWVVKDGVGKLSRLLFARWCGQQVPITDAAAMRSYSRVDRSNAVYAPELLSNWKALPVLVCWQGTGYHA